MNEQRGEGCDRKRQKEIEEEKSKIGRENETEREG